MLNSIVNLQVTPTKSNPAFLHTLEDLIGDDHLHRESNFDDWKFLKILQNKPEQFKILKFIHRKTNNIYALKSFENFIDYESEKEQIQKIYQQIGQHKANPYICICADSDDSERALFYEIGDCSLGELNEVMGDEECFWFEPYLFPQFNFIVINCYRILRYLLDNQIYPQNISEETIQLFRVGPRGDLRPKLMDIFQVDASRHKRSLASFTGNVTPQKGGLESDIINMQRTSYKQLGEALLDCMYSSVIAIEKQRRKVFYLKETDIGSYKYPHLSESAKLERVTSYFGGDERDPSCSPLDIQLQRDVVEFVRCLLQRGNKIELEKIFDRVEQQINPLLDIHGFQRKVIIKQLQPSYKKIKQVPEQRLLDDLETFLDLELIECGQNMLKDLENSGFKLYSNPDFIYYKLKYYLIMGQTIVFNAQIAKILKQRAKDNYTPSKDKSEKQFIYDIMFALSDSIEEDQKIIAFDNALEYFTKNYGKFNYQTLRIIIYKAQLLLERGSQNEVISFLEPITSDICGMDDNNHNFQSAKIELFCLYIKTCLDLGKINKRDIILRYLNNAEEVIKRIMGQKTVLNGDIKYMKALYAKDIEKDKREALKYLYEAMQLYKNSIGKKTFKYSEVLNALVIILSLDKQYQEVLPFVEENVSILIEIQHHNKTCEKRFDQAQEKLYEIYLLTGKGHDHLVSVWLTQGQHFADVKQFTQALQFMQVGTWLINKDYKMKLKNKSPGIIFVPSYEIDIREKLIQYRQAYQDSKDLNEKIEFYETALELCTQFYEDNSHEKQPSSVIYFSDQYFYFSIELMKLDMIKIAGLDINKQPELISDLWKHANNCLEDKYKTYYFDKFKLDTIIVFRGVCQKSENNGNMQGEKIKLDIKKIQTMIIQRYEKAILKIPRYVFFGDLKSKTSNLEYVPNSKMSHINDLSKVQSRSESLQNSRVSNNDSAKKGGCIIF